MALTKASLIDVNGQELILDADGDTSITADTDDQIDFKIGGTDRLSLGSDGKLKVTEIAQITSASLEIGNGDEKQVFDASGETIQFQTADTERLRISGNNLHLNGGTDARIQLGTGGAGANQVSNNTVHIRGDGTSMKLMAASGGSYLFEEDGTERFRIATGGKVHVGTTATIISGMVNVENVGAANCFTGKTSNNDYYIFAGSNNADSTTSYIRGNGNYYFAGTNQSDKDLKENIQPITESSLAKVKLLEPKTFNFKASEGFETNTKTGFIAQEVAEIFGTETGVASGTDGKKDMGVDTTGIVAHLTKAIQEQQEQIEALQSEINTLKGE